MNGSTQPEHVIPVPGAGAHGTARRRPFLRRHFARALQSLGRQARPPGFDDDDPPPCPGVICVPARRIDVDARYVDTRAVPEPFRLRRAI